jgi:curved DNA-binding protein CbpA
MPTIPPKRPSLRPGSRSSRPPVRVQTAAERDRTVMRWAAVADQVDWLSLLRLPNTVAPSDAQVRAAYHTFSRAFHPDQYRDAAPAVREAASRVFAAGADAYRVLSDPLLRLRYLRLLARGVARVPVEDLERAVRADVEKAKQATATQLAKTERGRAAAERADHFGQMGELAYQKRALEEAVALEPDNMPLAAKLEAIEAKLFAPRGRRT